MSTVSSAARRRSGVVAALVCFLLVLAAGGAPRAQAASGFVDVPPGAQFSAEIQWVADAGISTGWVEADGTRTYRPLAPIARDAMAAFLYRFEQSPPFAAPTKPVFADVPAGVTYAKEIAWLVSRGITTGWPDASGCGTYRPLAPIARDAMAAFLYRLKHGGVAPAPSTCGQPPPDCARQACVALTFDDGPGAYGHQLLDVLLAKRAPSTIFYIGWRVAGNESIVRRAAAEGHQIGNHSYSHTEFTRLTLDQQADEVARTNRILAGLGTPANVFRPPYGSWNADTRIAAGLPIILWDVDTLDWKHLNPDTTVETTLRDARAGSIVLMHELYPTTIEAVPRVIDGLRAKGYTLVTIDQLLPSKRAGSIYYRRG